MSERTFDFDFERRKWIWDEVSIIFHSKTVGRLFLERNLFLDRGMKFREKITPRVIISILRKSRNHGLGFLFLSVSQIFKDNINNLEWIDFCLNCDRRFFILSGPKRQDWIKDER